MIPFDKLPGGESVRNFREKIANVGKPSIFIGSSLESKKIADKIKDFFPAELFHVDAWYDGVFGTTRTEQKDGLSNMEYLKNFTDIYDFAIFIFVPEDTIVSESRFDMEDGKARTAQVTRHNVIFEFGMFLGRIGAKRSFILFDEKVMDFVNLFFTDLKENLDDKTLEVEISQNFRIELHKYKGNYGGHLKDKENVLPYENESMEAALTDIMKQVLANFNEIDITFLPATAMAMGYYNNFVQGFITNVKLLKKQGPYPDYWITKWKIPGDTIAELHTIISTTKKIRFKIVIPTSIEGSLQHKFFPDFNRDIFHTETFPGKSRSINFLSKRQKGQTDLEEWIIYDVPTTLNSSIDAIDIITTHSDIKELLKEKEIRNFKKSLEYKLAHSREAGELDGIEDVIEYITYEQFKEETNV